METLTTDGKEKEKRINGVSDLVLMQFGNPTNLKVSWRLIFCFPLLFLTLNLALGFLSFLFAFPL